jgi:hypothetical protein
MSCARAAWQAALPTSWGTEHRPQDARGIPAQPPCLVEARRIFAGERAEFLRRKAECRASNALATVRCGLPVAQGSPETLAAELGPRFNFVEWRRHLHSPRGAQRKPFSTRGS